MSAAIDTRRRLRLACRWLLLLRALWARPAARIAARTIYYLAILIALLLLYGRGDFSTPPFIYQGF